MYKLNQIETDLRKRISDDIDTSKVHRQQDKVVKNNTQKQGTYEKNDNRQKRKNNKNYITIDGINNSNMECTIEASNDELQDKGVYIDYKE